MPSHSKTPSRGLQCLWLVLLAALIGSGATTAISQDKKVYKWVDKKGQTHFTTTPPNISDTVPLKSHPGDIKIHKQLQGIWWSKEGDSTIKIEFKSNHVLFDMLNSIRSKIIKNPYMLAAYEVQGGKLSFSYNFHRENSMRGQDTVWTLFEPKENLLMLNKDGGAGTKTTWVMRKLVSKSKHPKGAPKGTFECAQRPGMKLKIDQGLLLWTQGDTAVMGGYVAWKSPVMKLDKVFDLEDPVNPRVEEVMPIEVVTQESKRLILKYPSEEVLVCQPK